MGMRMVQEFQITPGFFCMTLETLRSTFLCNNGKTSFWSVTITSHPSKAMPAKESVDQTRHSPATKLLKLRVKLDQFQPRSPYRQS